MLVCPGCGAVYRESQRACDRDGQALAPAAEVDWRIGTQVGNYRLLDLIGRGGMGSIYKGEHVYLDKPAAIKILHEHTVASDAANRLLREARAAATIGHANIIDVSDFGETPDGVIYIVMELVQGRSLNEVLEDEGQLPLLRAINIVNQIGRGLGAAHQRGIVHRDLKPANVMLQARPGRREVVRRVQAELAGARERFEVGREASYDFVTILDFGIAQFLDGSAVKDAGDAMVGTPHYMAPEIVRGEEVDVRADIYALGVMFYEMLTGLVPFDGENAREVLVAQCERVVPPLRFRNPTAEVSDAAERLIMRAMSKDPAARPQSIAELLEELQRCYGDETFLRNVEAQMPAAAAAGIRPRPKRLTEELSELFEKGDGSQILERALADPHKDD